MSLNGNNPVSNTVDNKSMIPLEQLNIGNTVKKIQVIDNAVGATFSS